MSRSRDAALPEAQERHWGFLALQQLEAQGQPWPPQLSLAISLISIWDPEGLKGAMALEGSPSTSEWLSALHEGA